MIGVVVNISNFSESPKNAIKNIYKSREYIGEIHIVDKKYSHKKPYYCGFNEDMEKLKEANVKVFLGPIFQIKKTEMSYIARIPPRIQFNKELFEEFLERKKNKNNIHWGYKTKIELHQNSFWYGYFLIFSLISLMWKIVTFWKDYDGTDIQINSVVRNGSFFYEAEKTSWFKKWCWNNEETRLTVLSDKKTLKSLPDIVLSPKECLKEIVCLEEKMKFHEVCSIPISKTWMLLYISFYIQYFVAFYYSLMYILLRYLSTSIPGLIFQGYIIWFMIIVHILALISMKMKFKIKNIIIYCFFLSFYVLTSPIIFILFKFNWL